MEKVFNKAEELADNIKQYVNARISSLKLQAAEKASSLLAVILAGLVVAFVFVVVLILLSIALSLLIGYWLGKIWLGFLIVAALYLLLGLLVWSARGRLIKLPIMNAIIRQIFKQDETDHK